MRKKQVVAGVALTLVRLISAKGWITVGTAPALLTDWLAVIM